MKILIIPNVKDIQIGKLLKSVFVKVTYSKLQVANVCEIHGENEK